MRVKAFYKLIVLIYIPQTLKSFSKEFEASKFGIIKDKIRMIFINYIYEIIYHFKVFLN